MDLLTLILKIVLKTTGNVAVPLQLLNLYLKKVKKYRDIKEMAFELDYLFQRFQGIK
jgi:hypothetical protein